MKQPSGGGGGEPSSSWVIAKLFSTLFDCPDLHVPSSNLQKYRNKITYSIPEMPDPLSPLAQDGINLVCSHVQQWERENCSGLFREVMVKVTRDGSLLVRVTIQASSEMKDENWSVSFVEYLRSQFPQLKCLCYNQTDGKARPTKEHPFTILYGDPHVMETTPNGLEFRIGPDSFSEVNHEVEGLQYDQAKIWLEDHFAGAGCNLVGIGPRR